MTEEILDDRKKKKRYNPDLADQVNEEFEREKRQEQKEWMRIKKQRGDVLDYIDRVFRNYITLDESVINNIPVIVDRSRGEKPLTKSQVEIFVNNLPSYAYFPSTEFNLKQYGANFISGLINGSTARNFTFDFRRLNEAGIVLDKFGYNLTRDISKPPVYIKIIGDLGDSLGYYTCGPFIFTVYGDIGKKIAHESEDCIFKIDGEVGTIDTDILHRSSEIYFKRENKWRMFYPDPDYVFTEGPF